MSSSPVTAPSGKNSSDSNGSSDSPPSPSSSDNSQSPPSPPDSNNNNNNNSDSNNNNNNSPPSPSDGSSSSPPSPSDGSSSSPPPPSDNSSPPPPQSDNSSSSPPPPKDDGSSPSPPSPSGGSSPPSPSGGSSTPKSSSRSPPPPHSQNSPSPPSRSNSNSGSPRLPSPSRDRSGEGPSRDVGGDSQLPLILGVTAGVVALLIIVAMVFMCTKKKNRRNDPMHYYMDQGPKGASVEYYSGQHQGWQNSPMDHVIKVPLSGPQSGPPGSGWYQPPPPPPMMSSSEVSSNFSGPRQPVLPPPSPFGFNQSTFTYQELAQATNGFSQANLLGQGGFGYVHKGVLASGKVVAVKSLKSGSGQGEREFQAEVEIISRVHHRHLVSLVGYCIAGGQRMLIYEFVPNGTLEYHLHGSGRPTMEWSTRMTIALGSAKGLAYLHEDCHPRIIHRDIKAANILVDDNWEAMVADFGLAKLSDTNVTHVSTRVMGTFGYLAPEYASSGKLTEKSDVFSFGVMLLELITGRRPVDSTNQYMEDSLVDWARPIMGQGEGNYEEILDPRLENNYNPTEMARMVACAAASVRHSAKRRPRMSQIVRVLEGAVSLDDLNEGTRPAVSSQFSSNGSSSDYDTAVYNADMKKFRAMALNSQEFPSSEYGAHTSDSGRQPSSSSASDGTNSREMNHGGNNRL